MVINSVLYEMVNAETYDHVGFVDTKTLRNDLGMTQSQLYAFLEQGKTYKNCYLVEDEELDRLEENFDISTMFRVTNSQNQELRWSITREGKILKYCNNEFQKELKPYMHHNSFVVNVSWTPEKNVRKKKQLSVAREYARAFLGLDEKDIVLYYGSHEKLEPEHIGIVDGYKFRSEYNGWWLHNKPIGLYKNGKLVKTFRSGRQAAKELYVSHTTPYDYVTQKRKRRLFDWDLRYLDEI